MIRNYGFTDFAFVLMILGIVPFSIKVLCFVAAYEIFVNVCKWMISRKTCKI